MSIDRNRRVWERASFGGEIDEFDLGVLHLVRWMDIQVEISSRQWGLFTREDIWLLTTAPAGHKIS